jgi:hypothetical protein
MKTVIKFYDREGKEQPPEKAVNAVRLTLDHNGKVVKTERFVVKP